MSALSTFNFKDFPVHAIDINGQIWFLANDVCDILEYANPRQAVQKNCKPKGVSTRDTPTKGGIQSMTYINEPNLYRLIIKSKKPEAEPFEEWVFEEVLPSIRKTGSYSLTINTKQQYQIKEAVMQLASSTGKKHQAIYRDLYNEFHVPKYQDLLAKDFDRAMKFLQTQKKALPNPFDVYFKFDSRRDGDYMIYIRNNKARLRKLAYCELCDSYGEEVAVTV